MNVPPDILHEKLQDIEAKVKTDLKKAIRKKSNQHMRLILEHEISVTKWLVVMGIAFLLLSLNAIAIYLAILALVN